MKNSKFGYLQNGKHKLNITNPAKNNTVALEFSLLHR